MTTKKLLLIQLALFACFSFLLVLPTAADPPTYLPTPPPAPALRPSATFTFADGTQITTRSTNGRFRLVGLHLNETVDIALQFPVVLLSSSAMAQPLDGGNIISVSTSPVATGGLTLIRFQAGNQPGLYRVLLLGFGGSARLQFWVADPNNPNLAMNAVVLNPNH
jgi:hypothetical protein